MREDILKKSGEMFLKLGYKSVTMDEIAGEMAISKKTLYKYFKNKEALVSESTKQVNTTIIQKVNEVMQKDFPAIQENFEIKKMFYEMFQFVGESPMFQLKKYYPEVHQEMITKEVETFRKSVKKNIRKGISEGSYRKDIDIDSYADFYFTLMFGLHEKAMVHEEMIKLETQAMVYHIRAMATLKGIGELEVELNK